MQAFWNTTRTFNPVKLCSNGAQVSPAQVAGPTAHSYGYTGHGVRILKTFGEQKSVCGGTVNTPPTNDPALQVLTVNGPGAIITRIQDGGYREDPVISGGLHDEITAIQIGDGVNGMTDTGVSPTVPGTYAPGTAPIIPPLTAPAPAPSPVPAPAEPLPMVPPSSPPDATPVTTPTDAPSPGETKAPAPAQAPSRSPSPSVAPPPVPASPAPQQIPPLGPLPTPAPLPVPTTPKDGVMIDGNLIGGSGTPTAPNLTAMAAELGRLERKAELTLEGGATAVALDALADLINDLIQKALAHQDGTTYQLHHACGKKPN